MVICLVQGADLHTAELMPLPLTVSCFSKIQIGLRFWYRLTRVVPEKGPLNGCVCVDKEKLTDNHKNQNQICSPCTSSSLEINRAYFYHLQAHYDTDPYI